MSSVMSDKKDHKEIERIFDEHIPLVQNLKSTRPAEIWQIGQLLIKCFKRGNKILLCGNGGSAADAQHLAAEFTGRFVRERRPLPAIALTTDASAMTAIANDFGFETVFSRQVQALSVKGDVVIGLSTSGKSQNVKQALLMAKSCGCATIGLLGSDGGEIAKIADKSIIVHSTNTARVQEMHITIGHILCDLIDTHFASSK